MTSPQIDQYAAAIRRRNAAKPASVRTGVRSLARRAAGDIRKDLPDIDDAQLGAVLLRVAAFAQPAPGAAGCGRGRCGESARRGGGVAVPPSGRGRAGLRAGRPRRTLISKVGSSDGCARHTGAVPWTADTIPPELAAILDERAGQEHSPGGAVRSCLAEILNRYDELRTLTVLIEFPATVTPAEVERFKAAWVEHRGGPAEYKLAGSGDD